MGRSAGRAALALAPALVWLACSSSSTSGPPATLPIPTAPGNAVTTGVVHGQTLAVQDAVAAKGAGDPAYPNQITVLLASTANVCARLQSSAPTAKRANAQVLSMVIGAASHDAVVTPGTYTVSDGTLAAAYGVNDEICNQNSVAAGVGSVTVKTVGDVGGATTGTFEVAFGPDHMSGSFNASTCVVTDVPSLDAGTDAGDSAGDGGTACVP